MSKSISDESDWLDEVLKDVSSRSMHEQWLILTDEIADEPDKNTYHIDAVVEAKQAIRQHIEQRERKAVAIFEKTHAHELDKISDRLHEHANEILRKDTDE